MIVENALLMGRVTVLSMTSFATISTSIHTVYIILAQELLRNMQLSEQT